MAENSNIKNLELRIAQLEKEKSQLLKLVSHDVKSPFNKLFALSNLLQLVSDNLNEEQLDYLNRMEWVVKEGLTVVRNLMDLRAIENDEVELQAEELNIESILNDTIKNYKKQLKAKGITIDIDSINVTTWSDKRSIERIVDNLISNAVKFTPKNSVIKINLLKKKTTIELKISSDSGSIPEEEINSLYQRNSPLSTRPTHGESALGNGLFIAQAYASKNSSVIKFNQKGTTVEFLLQIPLKQANY